MSKEQIFSRITTSLNDMEKVEHPDLNSTNFVTYENPVEKFIESLKSVGGNNIEYHQLKDLALTGNIYSDCFSELNTVDENFTLVSCDKIDHFITKAEFGVAENGAIWIQDKKKFNRAILFLCQHLYLILNHEQFVNNMFEAYKKIGSLENSFGTFISGPSKTADVEQCLVIGAHGPLSLTIVVE